MSLTALHEAGQPWVSGEEEEGKEKEKEKERQGGQPGWRNPRTG